MQSARHSYSSIIIINIIISTITSNNSSHQLLFAGRPAPKLLFLITVMSSCRKVVELMATTLRSSSLGLSTLARIPIATVIVDEAVAMHAFQLCLHEQPLALPRPSMDFDDL